MKCRVSDISMYVEYSESSPSGLIYKFRSAYDFKSIRDCDKFNSHFAGKTAGCVCHKQDGYSVWRFMLYGYPYQNSRVIYELINGPIPDGYEVDHKDMNPLNNNISNLRLATRSDNGFNMRKKSHSKQKLKGIEERSSGSYGSRICVNGNRIGLGTYGTPEEANESYMIAAINFKGEFARSK
jgi:hypothetical protein